ncbi:cupin domain-containing protein, partial [Pseudonocardia bannensis]
VGRGTVRDPLEIRTPGPAVFSVRTLVVPPGGTTGWHQHPGTETSIVRSGSISLVRQDACEPVVFGAGDAVFIPDGLPHLARNDGAEPAELVVTYLLAPDAPDRADVPPACPGQ